MHPGSFARWKAVVEGSANGRDIGLLVAAGRLADEIVTTSSRKMLRKMTRQMAAVGLTVFAEGLKADDGSPVTEEDNALFNWATGHEIAWWNDRLTTKESNLHH
jgi:hypothetical protein